MKRTVLLLAVLANSLFLNAQFVIDWQQCYGGYNSDKAFGIVEANDGFLVSGLCEFGYSGMIECGFGNGYYIQGGWLIKINRNGDLKWSTCFDDKLWIDRNAIDGPIYLFGGRRHNPETGNACIGLTRIDEDGNTIWNRYYDIPNRRYEEKPYGAIATDDDGILAWVDLYGVGVWLIKLDSLGNMEWDLIIETATEGAYDLYQTRDEGYLVFTNSIAGSTYGSVTPCHPATNILDGMLVKVSKDGSIEWNKCYGGTGIERFYTGIETGDGYLVAGTSFTDDGDDHFDHDIWLLRLNYDGDTIWSRLYGGTGNEEPIRVFQNDDGGFTVFANSKSLDGDVQSAAHWDFYGEKEKNNWWIFRTDDKGNLLWERALGSRNGSREELFDVVKHNDKEYTVAGYAPNFPENEWPYYHGDIDCTNSTLCGGPSEAVYWIVHIRDVFDYDAVEENMAEDLEWFEVFPIPAKDILTIKGGEDIFHYSMISAIGQEVIRGVAHNEQQINVSGMNEGVYFIRLTDGIHTCVKKVVLE